MYERMFVDFWGRRGDPDRSVGPPVVSGSQLPARSYDGCVSSFIQPYGQSPTQTTSPKAVYLNRESDDSVEQCLRAQGGGMIVVEAHHRVRPETTGLGLEPSVRCSEI
jgi:hypothetical protein